MQERALRLSYFIPNHLFFLVHILFRFFTDQHCIIIQYIILKVRFNEFNGYKIFQNVVPGKRKLAVDRFLSLVY